MPSDPGWRNVRISKSANMEGAKPDAVCIVLPLRRDPAFATTQ